MRPGNSPSDVLVIGSINMDLVVRVPQIPLPGQTLLATDFQAIPGGKGANQAVAAARLGVQTALVGRVGTDPFGQTLLTSLQRSGVNTQHVWQTPDTPSGVALITVSAAGQNAICVAPGANACLTGNDIAAAEPLLATVRTCVLQLEIPLATAVQAVARARARGVEIILDPAPAPVALPPELLAADILTPNETEAAQLLGLSVGQLDPAATAAALRANGARAVVLKLGARGCYVAGPEGTAHIPGHVVPVVDTTAAGDAFTAALAAARSAGHPLRYAAEFANAAGALACTRFGAQPSAPARVEVEALLAGGQS